MDILFINNVRGIAFILMFIYHIFVFIYALTGYNYLDNKYLDVMGFVARNIFILLVGVSLYLSYKNSKNTTEYKKKQLLRSIKIYFIAIYITILTYFTIRNNYVVFGVLHFISVSILLLYNFVNNIFILLLILLTCLILSNYKYIFKIPGNNNLINYINSVIGFSIYKNTIDSFPLIKWIPIVIIGIFIGRLIYYYQTKKQTKKTLNNKQNKKIKDDTNTSYNTLLSFLGKNTLMLYAIHIPIIIICIKLYINYI
jgi:uncharacterized membrane protein